MFDMLMIALWVGIPLIFLLLFLWNKLEELSGKKRSFHTGDMWSQIVFLSICGIISWLIDKNVLVPLIPTLEQWGVPVGMTRIGAYFLVMILIGLIYGPSKTLRVGEEKVELHKKRQTNE